jgi:hypothetical protein
MTDLSHRIHHRSISSAFLEGSFSPRRRFQNQPPCTFRPTRRTDSIDESETNFWSSPDGQPYGQRTDQICPPLSTDGRAIEHDSFGNDEKSLLSPPLSSRGKSCFGLCGFRCHQPSKPKPTRSTFPLLSSNGLKFTLDVVKKFNSRKNRETGTQVPSLLTTQGMPPVVLGEEFSVHRCYYFAARNCKGWTVGRSPHDACESCWVSFHHMFSENMYYHS